MALGGWMSGAIFDLTGSYSLAFANGLAWNLLNGAVALFLLGRRMWLAPRGTRRQGQLKNQTSLGTTYTPSEYFLKAPTVKE
jgi:hypothetical protein